MIIGFSGKILTGKTSLSLALRETLGEIAEPAEGTIAHELGFSYHSFGNFIKKTASDYYNYPVEWGFTQDGKLNKVSNGHTVRECLQMHGTALRKDDPFCILRSLQEDFKKTGPKVFIVDDIRLPEEYNFIRSIPGSTIIRMNPNASWKPGEHSNHNTETALDEGYSWDGIFSMPYSQSSLEPYALAIENIAKVNMLMALTKSIHLDEIPYSFEELHNKCYETFYGDHSLRSPMNPIL